VTVQGAADEDVSAWDPNVLPPAGASGSGGRDELILLANDSMRARRRPLAILFLWGVQTALASLVALPAGAAVASWYGRHPSGDAPLWQPGGLPLLDLFLDARGVRRETLVAAGLVFLLAGFADLIPIGSLIAAIGYVTRDRRSPPLRALLARALVAFPTLATLFAMTALTEGAIAGVAIAISSYVATAAQARLGDARADQTALLAALAILAPTSVVSVMHDLARAGAVRFRVRALRSWQLALNALARAPASVIWSWAWRGLAGWVPVGVGAIVAARFGGRGGIALLTLFVVHQIALIVRVAFRASWLASALRAVDQAHKVVPGKRRGER
jgi:hypothetical protein